MFNVLFISTHWKFERVLSVIKPDCFMSFSANQSIVTLFTYEFFILTSYV